jgi:sec-independent protein translocase protein TatC
MATEADEPRTEVEEEESEGGPVKTFLEHLEDLRWVLIKSLAFLGVAVVVCLLAGPVVVKVLMWPLERARTSTNAYTEGMAEPLVAKLRQTPLARWGVTRWLFTKKTRAIRDQQITLYFATNRLSTFQLGEKEQASFPFGTNRLIALRIEPMPFGTNEGTWVLGVRLDTNAPLVDRRDRLAVKIVNLSPAGSFIVAFRIAIYAGILIAAPFIIYFVAAFVFPALKMKEKKYVYGGMIWGLGLFFVGVSFCYFGLMPVALTASVQYSDWLGFSAPEWRAEDFVSFVSKFMLGMGVGFELPVVILVVAKLGLVNYAFLAKARPYVIIINVTLGAILTTPEVITQVLMAVPLQILYEITVWIVWWQERKEKKRLALEEKETEAAK